MRDIKFISYDGEYPNLCSGKLTYSVNDVLFEKEYVLSSGGECYWDSENQEEIITQGKWNFTHDFVKKEKESERGLTKVEQKNLLSQINKQISWGCCGGCM